MISIIDNGVPTDINDIKTAPDKTTTQNSLSRADEHDITPSAELILSPADADMPHTQTKPRENHRTRQIFSAVDCAALLTGIIAALITLFEIIPELTIPHDIISHLRGSAAAYCKEYFTPGDIVTAFFYAARASRIDLLFTALVLTAPLSVLCRALTAAALSLRGFLYCVAVYSVITSGAHIYHMIFFTLASIYGILSLYAVSCRANEEYGGRFDLKNFLRLFLFAAYTYGGAFALRALLFILSDILCQI